MKERIVFFGNERLVSGLDHTDAPLLRRLINDGYDIACIVSNYSEGLSRANRPLEVAEVAKEHTIPLLLPKSVKDIENELKGFRADIAVLAAYGQIVPQSIIDIFRKGIINVHPSLLPKYRGPTPIETAIANGDSETGVTIMRLVAKMDAGPMYAQKPLGIDPKETKFELYTKIAQTSAQLLSETLPSIISGQLVPEPQNEEATYSRLFTKEDSWLKPDKQTADEAERLVRAYLNYPKSKLSVYGYDVVVLSSHVSNGENQGLEVPFSENTYLTIDELVSPSGKRITGDEFLRGYSPKNDQLSQ